MKISMEVVRVVPTLLFTLVCVIILVFLSIGYSFGSISSMFFSALVVLLVITLWSTALIPPALVSIIFFFLSVVFSIAPPSTVFSGFHSGATWLVFGGLIIGLAVKNSGLDQRLVTAVLQKFPSGYLTSNYSIFYISFVLAWVVPSASARVALLVPILLSLSGKVGFKSGSRGSNGLILSGVMGTMTPAFAILPANVPNMSLFGATESIYNLSLTYGEYFILNFPILGIGSLILYPLVITILFSEKPALVKYVPSEDLWSKKEKRLLVILFIALVFWLTDTFHGISPAWVALGAAVFCLLPKIGVLSPSMIDREINFGPVVFVAGIIGLGSVMTYSGLGDFIADLTLRMAPLKVGVDYSNFFIQVLVGSVVGLFTTMPAQPSILVPMAEKIAAASGWSLLSTLSIPVVTWTMFPFFYQAPPLVLAVALGNLRVWWVTRMLLIYLMLSTVFILPLHYLWGQQLGYFSAQ